MSGVVHMTLFRDVWTSGNWRAAALLGLISSTFSTIVSQLTAARIGRDAAVDWMVVAAIPLRDPALQTEPSWNVIVAGILFHQWADFSWAVVFFGLLGRWTAGLSPRTILLIAPFWALFTSASEWLVLVPLVPFWQPIFTLEQSYWIGLFVHLTSASMYPLFPWLRDRVAGRRPCRYRAFAVTWSSLATAGVLGLGFVAFLGWQGRELPHIGGRAAYDQSFTRRMAAHHAQGLELAHIAVGRAQDPHMRALARMMVATQAGEVAIFDQWWRSWFGGPLPPARPDDHADMPGMLSQGQIEELRRTEGVKFDPAFVQLMSVHHRGAIAMAYDAIERAGDPRLRILAHAIQHQQMGEIELMHGTEGVPAVKAGVRALFGPALKDDNKPSVHGANRPSHE